MKRRAQYPESLMMSHGYEPSENQGALKAPLFQTSTFVFDSAEQGQAQFELAYGMREPETGEETHNIYSRLDNPTMRILEKRLCLWDEAEDCAVFSSGMAAITTVLLESLKPGDLLLHSAPVYGGTDHFINEVLPQYGVEVLQFDHRDTERDIDQRILSSGHEDRLAMIFVESPANPTNDFIDLEMCVRITHRFGPADRKPVLVVDNTYMGPVCQQPLKLGADLVVYSCTKYIGGHSDIIAGAVLGSHGQMKRIRTLRTLLGNMGSPWISWLLLRSLETLKLRIDRQVGNARVVAEYLDNHPQVESVFYPELLDPLSKEGKLYTKQCSGPGGMIAFELNGGREAAFQFLNALKLIKLAVSLGGTESLAQHPRTMTHAALPEEHLDSIGVTEGLVRLSIGVENVKDILDDLERAFECISLSKREHVELTHHSDQ